ncbi:MAG TPA: SPW repeat protein [Terriglobales bacterium]|nr:SPW repeat protein [Terriglobales bacterium]
MPVRIEMTGLQKSAAVLILIGGIWAIITPFAFSGGAGAIWNGIIFGILMIICSIGRMSSPYARGFSIANFIWGIWMIISPWALGFAGAGMRWSNDVTGIVVVICALINMREIANVVTMPSTDTGTGSSRRAA